MKLTAKQYAAWKKLLRDAAAAYEKDREERDALIEEYKEWREGVERRLTATTEKVVKARGAIEGFFDSIEIDTGSPWDEAFSMYQDGLAVSDPEDALYEILPVDEIRSAIGQDDLDYEAFMEVAENAPREWEDDEDEEGDDE